MVSDNVIIVHMWPFNKNNIQTINFKFLSHFSQSPDLMLQFTYTCFIAVVTPSEINWGATRTNNFHEYLIEAVA